MSAVTSESPVSEIAALINSLDSNQQKELGSSFDSNTVSQLSIRPQVERSGGMKRRLVVLGSLAAIIALVVTAYAYFNMKNTIANGERDTTPADWGYIVEQYSFRDRMRLTLWSDSSIFSSSSEATLDLSNVSVKSISEARWLANSRAIYLNMLVVVDEKEQSAKVIYDFQRGEMYTSSPLDLWRVPNAEDKDVKMNDEEFQSVLKRFTGETPGAVAPPPEASAAPSTAPSAAPSAEVVPSAVAPAPPASNDTNKPQQ